MRLVGSITGAAATLVVDVTTGLPSVPFTLLLDPGLGVEEVMTVTAVGGTTLTVTRGVGGTSAQAHTNGAEVRHAYYGQDFQDSRDHEGNTATPHGVTGGVPGKGNANTWTQDQTFSANITAANLFKAVTARATADVGPTSGTAVLSVVAAPSITGDASKRFKVTSSFFKVTGTVNGDEFYIYLNDSIGVNVATFSVTISGLNAGGRTVSTSLVPTAGAHVYTLQIQRLSGTGTATVSASAFAPAEILVEQV